MKENAAAPKRGALPERGSHGLLPLHPLQQVRHVLRTRFRDLRRLRDAHPRGLPQCPQCGGKSFKTVRLPDDPSIVNFVKKKQ